MTSTATQVIQALQAYDLQEEGEGKYRCNSPLRSGSNSHAFILKIEGDEHGAYFDHVSLDSGSLYDLARVLNIELPQPVAVASTKRAYAGIEDYAAAHGITADVLKKAGWYETVQQKRPALAFKTSTGTRYRFLDGEKPFYKSEQGYQRSWYGLTPSTAKQLASGAALVVCNGEISTVVARHYGVAAACVTGGEKAIPPDLMQELKVFLGVDDAPPIIVAFDCDDTGRQAARLIAKQLRAEGFIAKAVDLGFSKGGDLADFCMLHTDDSRRQLNLLPAQPLKAESRPTVERDWVIIPASELKNLPPLEWIIPGEIPEQSLVVIFGESGAGKSFIGLDYALRVAQDHSVVYMPTEGEWGYAKRVGAWCEHHKKGEGKLMFIFGAASFFDRDKFEMLMTDLTSLNPYMLVVDTLAMAMAGGDENSARDMGIILKACRRIQRELDTTVILIHHVGKAGVTERGSTALRGGADVMIRVSPADDLVLVECSKTKDEKAFEPRYMHLLPVGDSLVPVPAEKVIQQKAGDPLTKNQRKLLDVLALEVNSDGVSIRDLAEVTGLSVGAVWRALSNMLRLGYVHKPSGSHAITDEGRKVLNADSPDSQAIQLEQSELADDSGDSSDSHVFLNESQLGLFESRESANHPNQANHPNHFGSPDYYRLGL